MNIAKQLLQKINNISNNDDFNTTDLEVFYFQYRHNLIYRQWVDNLSVDIKYIKSVKDIPFLPISFFKTQELKAFDGVSEAVFLSSGTSGKEASKHDR